MLLFVYVVQTTDYLLIFCNIRACDIGLHELRSLTTPPARHYSALFELRGCVKNIYHFNHFLNICILIWETLVKNMAVLCYTSGRGLSKTKALFEHWLLAYSVCQTRTHKHAQVQTHTHALIHTPLHSLAQA